MAVRSEEGVKWAPLAWSASWKGGAPITRRRSRPPETVLPTQLSPDGEGRGAVHAVRARTPPVARACHAVRARTPLAACAFLEKGIEGENKEDGERLHHTWRKTGLRVDSRNYGGLFIKHPTEEPNHGTLAYFIITRKYARALQREKNILKHNKTQNHLSSHGL
jgi:hypothetical protein